MKTDDVWEQNRGVLNSLQIWIGRCGFSTVKVMHLMQDNGVISDNCIASEDVAQVDADRAVTEFLTRLDKVAKERRNPQPELFAA